MNLNIAGAVVHYDGLIKTLPILGIRNKDIRFVVYDGPNLCQWNGGRINRNITLTSKMVEMYNKFGIAMSLTFTNPVIDLSDETGNTLLEMLNQSGIKHGIKNKVVLINEDLRCHIKNNTNIEVIYSITGHPSEIELTSDSIQRYLDLEKKYDYIVPKFEVVFKENFYRNITPQKYELLINDTCVYGCTRYLEHFQSIAKQNELSKNPWQELGQKYCSDIEECWVKDFDPSIRNGCKETGMDYTPDMIKDAMSLGYQSFKISGRENDTHQVLSEVKRFLEDVK